MNTMFEESVQLSVDTGIQNHRLFFLEVWPTKEFSLDNVI